MNDSKKEKNIVVFDFDQTLIDCNSDTYIEKLLPNNEELLKINYKDDWTLRMQKVFDILHLAGIKRENITKCLSEIELGNGMNTLLSFIADNKYSDIIIISDANIFFIETILQANRVDFIKQIFTNPACFDSSGRLEIERYHTQDWCDLSSKNLCKGRILENYIKNLGSASNHRRIYYVGDGINDLCPALKLSSFDVLLPRDGYKLAQMVECKEFEHRVKAQIVTWKNGLDLLQFFKNSL